MNEPDIQLIRQRLRSLFDCDDRPSVEKLRLVELMALMAAQPPLPDLLGFALEYENLKARFIRSIDSGDADLVEESFLEMYCHLHGHEAPYTRAERRRIDEVGGYWCHAGGLSPILKAGDWIGPETVSADYGAGNGLQTMLMMKMYPHRQAIQIEISTTMIEIGKRIQGWLGIEPDSVRWIADDIFKIQPMGMDFIYMYRPVKPEGAGRMFYEQFAVDLQNSDDKVVIFSIADCLKDFLSDDFKIFYTDGHLTCFKRDGR